MKSNKLFAIAPIAMPEAAALTAYYDGACPVCSRKIAVYRREAGADQCVLDASSCAESAIGTGLSREMALARFRVRRAGHGPAARRTLIFQLSLTELVVGWYHQLAVKPANSPVRDRKSRSPFRSARVPA